MYSRFLVVLLGVCLIATAQEPPSPSEPPSSGPEAQPPSGGRPNAPGRGSEPEIKPYEKVITKEAKTSEGIFKVHRIKNRVYYEIPKAMLGKDMLWVSQLERTTLGAGYGGSMVGNRVVRWERAENRVLLRDISYEIVADEREPISRAVHAANNPTIIQSYNIEALNKDGDPVIEVTRLFTTEVAEFSPRRTLRARGFDASRSFIESVKVFPENINVEVSQTFTSPPETPGAGGGQRPPTGGFGGQMRGNSATVVMHYSMVKLPDEKMVPRLYDDRVGFFSIRQQDYGTKEHRASERRYITRWRLDKKDPGAAISEPVKPIVYYVDPATPTEWVPYVKKGIEDWQPAFEAAGFRNAIIAKEAPSKEEDPNWSPEDARYSVVRWLPSTIKNASGPHVHDPRTGQILESDIQMYHNILELQRDWYFSQAGPLDKRAQKLPLPNDLMGELIRYVVAHEVGHTLGLQHNMKASSTYPFEKLRDKEWLAKMGHTPTLMDYSRFNYVVQPEDNIDPKLLIPGIGPYDKFAITWGYKPVPNARTPEDETAALEEIRKAQDTTPWLRFSTAGAMGADPGELTEAVGDADAVQATTLGTKNLKRVMGMLLTAVPQEGEDYEDLGAVYSTVVGQWTREVNHVAAIVGGFDSVGKHGGQDGVIFRPVPKARQKAAVQYLNANVFATPDWLIDKEVLRRIEPMGAMDRILNAQRSVLSNLLSGARMARLYEQEALDGAEAYKATEMLADLRQGLFSELSVASPKIDAWRRNLQRAYVEMINDKLNGRPQQMLAGGGRGGVRLATVNPNDDTKGLLRAELRAISARSSAKLAATSDAATRAHLEYLKDRIAMILDPKVLPNTGSGNGPGGGLPSLEEDYREGFTDTCWPDLRVIPFFDMQ